MTKYEELLNTVVAKCPQCGRDLKYIEASMGVCMVCELRGDKTLEEMLKDEETDGQVST